MLFFVFFSECPLEGVDRSTLIIPCIYYSSRFSQRHRWIFASRIFMDSWQFQEACKCLWDSQMRLLAGRRQQIFLRVKHFFIFTWAAGKTHSSCLTVMRSSTYRGGIGSTWQPCKEVLAHNIHSLGRIRNGFRACSENDGNFTFYVVIFSPFV